MAALLLIVATILVFVGIARLVTGDIAVGVVLLVAACAVGPGGWSIFH